jgi:hypothetical protein
MTAGPDTFPNSQAVSASLNCMIPPATPFSDEMVEISAEDDGVERYLINAILDDLTFDTAVEKLLPYSLISCNT